MSVIVAGEMPMMRDDTIAAIATAPGEAGIAVVRISGPDAFHIADDIFQGKGKAPSTYPAGHFLHGRITGAEGTLDEVLLLLMRAPHSYTREDVVEIQGHGGNRPAQRILRRVLECGARPAEPGEFTQRAFLNGRIDLVQAEAVLDLIRAQSDRSAAAAIEQLEGSLSTSIDAVYNNLIVASADIEASLDFPDEEMPDFVLPDLKNRLVSIEAGLDQLLATWQEGHLLREGALVVISGRPNVGKSTLLNALLGRDRAIVSAIPGTTRDTIEESFVLRGMVVRLVDTAGLRKTDCEIEQEGIRRTKKHMEKADFNLFMVDASQPLHEEERQYLSGLPPDKSLVIVNKCDLGQVVSKAALAPFECVETSLMKSQGEKGIIEILGSRLMANVDFTGRPHATISERHRHLLLKAKESVATSLGLLDQQEDDKSILVSAHLRETAEFIGLILGKTYHDELLNEIFARFCIGK